MTQGELPLHFQFDRDRNIATIFWNDRKVGVCHPEIAAKIVEMLQENERLCEDNSKLARALQMACEDSLAQRGIDSAEVTELMERYQEKTQLSAIALLLRDRQRELDISDKEFVFFCNSYRLSPSELRDISRGKEPTPEQRKIISRILRR